MVREMVSRDREDRWAASLGWMPRARFGWVKVDLRQDVLKSGAGQAA
jgi:hypothetical protein